MTENVSHERRDKNCLCFAVIAKETLKSKHKFLVQFCNHSGKIENDAIAEPAPSSDF